MTSPGWASAQRVGWIALDAMRSLLRQRLVLGFLGAGLVGALAGRALRELDFGGAPQRFVLDLGFASLGLLGLLVATVGTAQLVVADRESGSAALILAKPVRPIEYLAGQWLGVVSLVSLFAVAGGTAVGVLVHTTPVTVDAWGEWPQPRLTRLPSGVACATIALLFKLALVGAGARLVASLTRGSTTAIVVTVVAVIAAHLRGGAETYYAGNGIIAQTAALALRVLPNLGEFELAGLVAAGDAVTFAHCATLGAHTAAYAGLYLLAAAQLEQQRGL